MRQLTKLFLSAAIIFVASTDTFAQTKKDTIKAEKSRYEKIVKVPQAIYEGLVQSAHSFKEGVIYNSLLQPDEKNKIQLNIDQLLFVATVKVR